MCILNISVIFFLFNWFNVSRLSWKVDQSSTHSTPITTRGVFSTMSLIYTRLMAALDLAGIIFNMRMLWSCFNDKRKYTLLQKCRTLAVCQCACQVAILLAGAAELWEGLETEYREFCDVFRVLSSSMLFFQGCNLMTISITCFDQPAAHGTSKLCSKLKILAALSLGLAGSVMIWCDSCIFQEFRFQMVLRVIFVVRVAFVILLLAWDARNHNIQDQLDEDKEQVSMKTCSLLWKVLKENRRPVLFVTLLFVCLLILSSWSSRSAESGAQIDVPYSVITRFVVGIVLPVTFTDLIELSKQEENGLETAFI